MGEQEEGTGPSGVEGKKKSLPGVVLLSRIPPTMTQRELRSYLEPFGKVGRIYFAPDAKTIKNGYLSSRDPREWRKARFTEGWVEFLRVKDAKNAALALNGTMIGGRRTNRLYGELWNIKYLPDFQWSNLLEATRYEREVRQQKLRAEIAQARKANQQYVKQAERAVELEKIAETRAKRRAKAEGKDYVPKGREEIAKEQLDILGKKFAQRKPIAAPRD